MARSPGGSGRGPRDRGRDRDEENELKDKLVTHLQAHREITTQGFKELVGQSRKFVIPLSEYFDREKVTLRVGEKRVLRRG